MSDPLKKQGEKDSEAGKPARTDLPSNSQAQDRYMAGYGTKK